MNGAYWRELKQDGVLDRDVPTGEANAQKYAGSHDRHPVPDLALNSWHLGFGRAAQGSKQPWEVERLVSFSRVQGLGFRVQGLGFREICKVIEAALKG